MKFLDKIAGHIADWFGIYVFAFVIFACVSWIKNVYELTQCDFETPYSCEVLHGIGIPIAPISWVGAWVDFGK